MYFIYLSTFNRELKFEKNDYYAFRLDLKYVKSL